MVTCNHFNHKTINLVSHNGFPTLDAKKLIYCIGAIKYEFCRVKVLSQFANRNTYSPLAFQRDALHTKLFNLIANKFTQFQFYKVITC